LIIFDHHLDRTRHHEEEHIGWLTTTDQNGARGNLSFHPDIDETLHRRDRFWYGGDGFRRWTERALRNHGTAQARCGRDGSNQIGVSRFVVGQHGGFS